MGGETRGEAGRREDPLPSTKGGVELVGGQKRRFLPEAADRSRAMVNNLGSLKALGLPGNGAETPPAPHSPGPKALPPPPSASGGSSQCTDDKGGRECLSSAIKAKGREKRGAGQPFFQAHGPDSPPAGLPARVRGARTKV